MRWILLLTLAGGCAAYDPAHPCLDLSTETWCDSGVVQASKGINAAVAANPPPAPPAVGAYVPPGGGTLPGLAPTRCTTRCRPSGVSQVVCEEHCW